MIIIQGRENKTKNEQSFYWFYSDVIQSDQFKCDICQKLSFLDILFIWFKCLKIHSETRRQLICLLTPIYEKLMINEFKQLQGENCMIMEGNKNSHEDVLNPWSAGI